jgi:nucleotide-binding universal stress UspA family protein
VRETSAHADARVALRDAGAAQQARALICLADRERAPLALRAASQLLDVDGGWALGIGDARSDAFGDGGLDLMPLPARGGDEVDHIVRTAREVAADAVVFVTKPRSRLRDRLLGGISFALVQQSPCPVLLVPADLPPTSIPHHGTTLVAWDGHDDSLHSLGHALSLTRGERAVCVHVGEGFSGTIRTRDRDGRPISHAEQLRDQRDFNEVLTTRAATLAERGAGELATRGITVTAEGFATTSSIADTIADRAADERVGMVVLASRYPKAVDEILHHVLYDASKPVLVLRLSPGP